MLARLIPLTQLLYSMKRKREDDSEDNEINENNNNSYLTTLEEIPQSIMPDKDKIKYMDFISAIKNNDIEMIKSIHQQDPSLISMQDEFGNKVMHIAVLNGNIEAINTLSELDTYTIYEKNNDGNLPIHFAAMKGDVETIKALIHLDNYDKRSASLYSANNSGRLPIHVAAMHDNGKAIKAFYVEDEDLIQTVDREGDTSMHIAASMNKLEAMDAIYKINKDLINTISANKNKYAPIYSAIKSNNIDVIKWLIDKGIDVNMHIGNNSTPLYAAVKYSCYLKNSKDNTTPDAINQNKAIIRFLKKEGANIVNVINIAAFMGEDDVIEEAFKNGDCIDSFSISGSHVAYGNYIDSIRLAKINNNLSIVKLLTEKREHADLKLYPNHGSELIIFMFNNSVKIRKDTALPKEDYKIDLTGIQDSQNFIDAEDANIIADMIRNNNIIEFSVSNIIFTGTDQIKPILDAIDDSNLLKQLNIEATFKNEAMASLKNFLKNTNSLNILTINFNDVDTNNQRDICNAVAQNKYIKKLVVSSRDSCSSAIKAIIPTTSINNILIENITDDDAKALIDLFKHNKSVYNVNGEFDDYDVIPAQTLNDLAKIMKNHTGIINIPLGENSHGSLLYKNLKPKKIAYNNIDSISSIEEAYEKLKGHVEGYKIDLAYDKLCAYSVRNTNYLKKVFKFINDGEFTNNKSSKDFNPNNFDLSSSKFGMYKLYQGVNKNALSSGLMKSGSNEFFGENKTIEQKHDYIKSIFEFLDYNIHLNFLTIAAVCKENSLDSYYKTDTAQNNNVDIIADSGNNNNTNNDAVATDTMAIDLVTSSTEPVMKNAYIPQELMMAISCLMGNGNLWDIDYGDHFIAVNSSKVNEYKIVGEVNDI